MEHASKTEAPQTQTASGAVRAKPATMMDHARLSELSQLMNASPAVQRLQLASSTMQRKGLDDEELMQQKSSAPTQTNNTGLPDNLKSGIESLSGLSMDQVRVHRNSSKPAQMNAHAFAQGSDIHLAPGQDQHLPHEAWHVVQQAQGRVKPTMQMQGGQMKGGVPVNDDPGLEQEADVMGGRAMQQGSLSYSSTADPNFITAPVALQLHPLGPSAKGAILQRQVIAEKHNDTGKFTFDRKENLKSIDDIYYGISITITYRLNGMAPDERRLYMSQIVQTYDLGTASLYNFADSAKEGEKVEAGRDLARTTGQFGEEAGYYIDQFYSTDDPTLGHLNAPRSSSLDPVRSIAYNTLGTPSHGIDGRKNGEHDVNNPASLSDTPGSGKPMRFSFETAAIGEENGPFGALPWSVVLGKKDEPPVLDIKGATNGESINFREAKNKFNDFFRNPGTAASPERLNVLTNIEVRGLGGIPEAFTTLHSLALRAEKVLAMPASATKVSLMAELKQTITYRFDAIKYALDEADPMTTNMDQVASLLEELGEIKADVEHRIGALDG